MNTNNDINLNNFIGVFLDEPTRELLYRKFNTTNPFKLYTELNSRGFFIDWHETENGKIGIIEKFSKKSRKQFLKKGFE